ncbi:MAG: hypothetical protein PVH19_12885, partial [Planctomycetia bacterium]
MTRPKTFVRLLVATFCAAALLAAPAFAGDAVLKVIPKESIAFAVVNGLDNADQVCTELSKATQVPLPTPSLMFKKATGLDMALDKKGDMAVVFYQGTETDSPSPPMFVLLPVTDFEKLLAQFEPEEVTKTIKEITIGNNNVLIASKGKYAVVAQAHQQEELEAFLAAKSDISAEMKAWSDWTKDKVVYGVLTNYGLHDFLKEGIESLEGTFESFEQFQSSSPQLDQIKKTLKLYVTLLKAIRDNTDQMGIGFSKVGEGAIQIAARCDMKPGSDLAKTMGNTKALSTNPMAVLPNDSFVLAAGGPVPQKLVSALITFAQEMGSTPLGFNAEQNKKMIQASVDSMKDVVAQSFMMGVPSSKEAAMIDSVTAAIWVKNADSYFTNYKKQVEMTNKLLNDPESKMPMKMDVKEKTIDGYKTLVVTADLSGMTNMPELAPAKDFLEKFYGEGMKFVTYIAKVNDTVVVTAVGSEENLKKVIEVVKSKSGSLAEDAGVKKVTAMLPKDAQWFFYWSPNGTVEFVNWILEQLPEEMKINIPFEKLPPCPPCTPIGIATKVNGNTIEETCILPPDTIRG